MKKVFWETIFIRTNDCNWCALLAIHNFPSIVAEEHLNTLGGEISHSQQIKEPNIILLTAYQSAVIRQSS